jgi:hypothetical protein
VGRCAVGRKICRVSTFQLSGGWYIYTILELSHLSFRPSTLSKNTHKSCYPKLSPRICLATPVCEPILHASPSVAHAYPPDYSAVCPLSNSPEPCYVLLSRFYGSSTIIIGPCSQTHDDKHTAYTVYSLILSSLLDSHISLLWRPWSDGDVSCVQCDY